MRVYSDTVFQRSLLPNVEVGPYIMPPPTSVQVTQDSKIFSPCSGYNGRGEANEVKLQGRWRQKQQYNQVSPRVIQTTCDLQGSRLELLGWVFTGCFAETLITATRHCAIERLIISII